jgi:2-methylisocitrate lyase-like PEP mutase family enzyme
MSEAAEQLGTADLEQPEVAAVVHDAHRITVGEDDPVARDLDQTGVGHDEITMRERTRAQASSGIAAPGRSPD